MTTRFANSDGTRRNPSQILLVLHECLRFASFLHARVSGLGRLCCKFLGNAKSVHGMFQRPFAQFVSSQVISLVVGNCSGMVSVNRKVVQL
jgi:hypothetical protein